ncbi:hypothetical protein SO802_022473 [Lithocarpus litseifolius]|uniref:Reverse transcriptase RNase H-like domain-containing protein n=1 Tax=Lithocarpus litseifolius TaxID=425828 RepID=A0AAW2C6S7_9ROSI
MQERRPIAFHSQALKDQQSLKYLLEQKIGNPAQQKWITKLLGYAFIVEYKKGKENVVADALSRQVEAGEIPSQDGILCMISFPTPDWLVQLKANYAADPFIQSILKAFQSGVDGPKGFTLQNGLLLYKGRIYLGICDSLKTESCSKFLMVLIQAISRAYTGSKGTFIGLD